MKISYRMTGEEYRKRLEGFSPSTTRMITKCNQNEEIAKKKLEIVTNPDLNEQQIAEKLKEILNNH